MPLRAIEPQRLYQQVADQVAELIRAGHWQAGTRLPPERDLAVRLKVSRPVVREAMVALELAGFVEVRTGAGTFVRKVDPGHRVELDAGEGVDPGPFELIAARRLVEGETAAIAAQRIERSQLAGLRQAIERMEADIEGGVQGIGRDGDGDWLFHVRIAAATGNSVIESIVSQLWLEMRRPLFAAFSSRTRLPENARRALTEHRAIYDRIAAGDADAARTVMHQHLDRVAHVLLHGVDDSLGHTA